MFVHKLGRLSPKNLMKIDAPPLQPSSMRNFTNTLPLKRLLQPARVFHLGSTNGNVKMR